MADVQGVKIGDRFYKFHIEHNPENEWPWFVNVYPMRASGGFEMPVAFCAGATREDAIGRVTRRIPRTPEQITERIAELQAATEGPQGTPAQCDDAFRREQEDEEKGENHGR